MGVRRRSRRIQRPSRETSDSEQELDRNQSTSSSPRSSGSSLTLGKEACPDRTSYAQKKCKEAIDEYHEKAIISSFPTYPSPIITEVVDRVDTSGVSSAATTPPSGAPVPRSKVIVLGNSGGSISDIHSE